MSAVLRWCDGQDVLSRGESPTTRAVRRAAEEDAQALLDAIEQEYIAFRLHHANAHTVDTPEGFGRRFREWMTQTLQGKQEQETGR